MDQGHSKLLKFMGVLELLAGLIALGVAVSVIMTKNPNVVAFADRTAMNKVFMFALPITEIIAGLAALSLAKKPSSYMVCVVLGIILIGVVWASFLLIDSPSTGDLTSHAVSFILPILYLFGAFQNKKYI
ncbi:MAG: hypothetical protein RR929_00725 [Erysipelotrichaceae bacterium]